MVKTEDLTKEEMSVMYDMVDPINFNVFDIKISEFIEFCEDPKKLIDKLQNDNEEIDILEIIANVKGFNDNVSKIFEYLSKFEIQQTQDEKNATKGIDFPNFFETMLIDCVEWFHLNSMEQAENIKVSEWFLFKKKQLANQKYENNYSLIMDKKYKK